MFQFPGFASLPLCIQDRIPLRVGCPIRTFTVLRSLAAPRNFSQLATSFFASESQGIPLAPFVRFLYSLFLFPNCSTCFLLEIVVVVSHYRYSALSFLLRSNKLYLAIQSTFLKLEVEPNYFFYFGTSST